MRRVFLGSVVLASNLSSFAAEPTGGAPPQPATRLNAQTQIPAGPFSAWPEDAKHKAVAALRLRCTLVAGMAEANYNGSKDAALEYMLGVTASCIAGQMPSDWPDISATQESARIHFKFAHELDPRLPSQPPDMKWPKPH